MKFRKGHYVRWREEMKQYGLPLNTVLCGKIIDGRYIFGQRKGFKK